MTIWVVLVLGLMIQSYPPIEEFYSQLTDSNISEDDYRHARRCLEYIWYKKYGRIS